MQGLMDRGLKVVSEVFDAYSKMVYWTAFDVCGDFESASDTLVKVFLCAIRNRRLSFMKEPAKWRWFYIKSRSAGRKLLTGRSNTKPVNEGNMSTGKTEQNAEAALLQQAMTRIPSEYKSLILLRYYAQAEINQISWALNLPYSIVERKLKEAKSLLEEELR